MFAAPPSGWNIKLHLHVERSCRPAPRGGKSRFIKCIFLQRNICTQNTNTHSKQLPPPKLHRRQAAARQEWHQQRERA